jgi:lysozyme
MIRGIDVSYDQGAIDWGAVAGAGIRFAIVKATEGAWTTVDPRYEANVAGAKAVGLSVGGYFVIHPYAGADPTMQAESHYHLSGGIGTHPGELPPMIDFELPDPTKWAEMGVTAASIRTWLLAYRERMTALWARVPLIYTYNYFAAATGLSGLPALAQSPLVLASYPAQDVGAWPADSAVPAKLAPWTSAAFWQCSEKGRVAGIQTPVDLDVFLGTQAELVALCANGDASTVAQAATEQALDASGFHDDTPPPAVA